VAAVERVRSPEEALLALGDLERRWVEEFCERLRAMLGNVRQLADFAR
jgi:hypothetical protein